MYNYIKEDVEILDYLNNVLDFFRNISFNDILKNKDRYFLYYYIFINVYAFILIWIDKYRSRNRKFRVRELIFFVVSIIGGALGSVMGMTVFRHKTQKESFYIGIPLIFVLNIITVVLIYKYVLIR